MKLKNKNIFEVTRYKKETGEDLPNWQDQLLEYEKQGGYYIHFSYIPRMSLYLVNEYNTPIGFYVYPLKRDKIADFAINRPYAIIVKPKPNAKILQLADYSDVDLDNDIKKLLGFGYSQEIIDKASEEAKFDTAAAKIWNITRVLSGIANLDESIKFLYEGSEQEEEELGERFYAITDIDNLSLEKKIEAYENEFSQEEKDYLKEMGLGTYYFARAKFDSLINMRKTLADKIKSYQKEFSQEEKDYLITKNRGETYFRRALKSSFQMAAHNAQEKNNFLKNLSPIERELLSQSIKLDSYIPHPENVKGGGVTGKWTTLLKKLGYDGVNDDCLQIIHENEPCQAVFFDVIKLDLVKIIELKGKQISKKDQLFSLKKTILNKAKNLNLSDLEIQKLIELAKKYNILEEIAYNENTSPKILAILAREENERIRTGVADNPNTLPESLLYLLRHTKLNLYIKQLILNNPNIPLEALVILSKDDNTKIKIGVASNKKTPPEVLADLANDTDELIRISVASNLNTSKETFMLLAKENNLAIFEEIAFNHNAPPELLSYLAGLAGNAEYDIIYSFVVQNPNTPPETLLRLAKDKKTSSYVLKKVAENTNTPLEALVFLINHKDYDIRKKVLRNKNLSSEFLLNLAKNKNTPIESLILISQNPNTPAKALEHLATHKDTQINLGIATNKNTPPEILTMLADQKDNILIRLAVVNNISTPKSILEKLASTDIDNEVRQEAKNTLKKLETQNLTEKIIIEKILWKLLRKS